MILDGVVSLPPTSSPILEGLNMENPCCEICDQCEKNYSYLIGRRFLKTMTGDFSRRLSIPQKFMRHFKGELRKGVYLKGLRDYAWHIGLEKNEDNVFLQNAWQYFVEAHNLKKNDTLLFEYEGNSVFSVSMFDASHECEKDQSDFINFSIEEEETREEEEEEEEEDSLIGLQPNVPSPHETRLSPKMYMGCVSSRKRRAGNRPRKENLSLEQLEAHNAGMDNAMSLAVSFQSSKPSFLSKMSTYNIHTAFYLMIPKEFARKYLPEIDSEVIFRLPSGEKKWKMKYSVTKSAYRLCGNWRGFVTYNSLKVGDVCVLELSGDEPLEMTVHIFQA